MQLLDLYGAPVFTDVGGIGYIFKPTFGYLIGFIVVAYVKELTFVKTIFTLLFGLFFIYLFE